MTDGELEALLVEMLDAAWPLLAPLLTEPVTWAVAAALLVSSGSGRRGVRRWWRLLRRVHARRRAARLRQRRRVVLRSRSRRRALYRWYPACTCPPIGPPGYIGTSYDVLRREAQHNADLRAFMEGDVQRRTEWFPDRESADAAEEAAIRAERPIHNVAHNGRGRVVR